ncbi:MAG TPA: hypothetical protein VD902_14495 [Symbiobacteriaceae bacterium]|nr:hypothetical protein [Symbiobacteriaceae bacterium]
MMVILGFGIVCLFLGLMVWTPLSLGNKANQGMSQAFYGAFQVSTLVGISLVMFACVNLLLVG